MADWQSDGLADVVRTEQYPQLNIERVSSIFRWFFFCANVTEACGFITLSVGNAEK